MSYLEKVAAKKFFSIKFGARKFTRRACVKKMFDEKISYKYISMCAKAF